MKLIDINITRFCNKISIGDTCLIWIAYKTKEGYGQFRIGKKMESAHRVAWVLYNKQEIPKNMFILHKCNTPSCVSPWHLRVGTNQDNMNDKVTADRQAKGEKNGRSKLSDKDVLAIYKSTEKQSILAAKFGVRRQCISDIKTGYRWGWLTNFQLSA